MDVVFWRGWLNLEETESLNCHIGLHQWHSYQPSAKFCLKEAWKIWLQMIWGPLSCYYASWLPNCWKNCHLPWVIYIFSAQDAPFGTCKFIKFWTKNCNWNLKFSNRSCQRSKHCSHKMRSSWNPLFCKQLKM